MDGIKELDLFMDDIAEQLDIAVETVAKKLTFDGWRILTERTPVDTGRAQNSWNVSLSEPDLTVAEVAESYTLQEPDLSQIDGTTQIFITSSLDYIEALENGHSQRAPQGMVRITVAEIGAEIDTLIDQLNES